MGRPKNFEPDVAVADAMEAFWTNGYAGTSPADLVKATGVAKGSLYHAFGSKRELFGKALDLYDKVGAEVAAEHLSRPGTAKECIREYLRYLVDMDLECPDRRGCLAVNVTLELAGRDEEAMKVVRRIAQRGIELLAARVEQGKRDGDVAADVDAMVVAQFLMNTIGGLRVMAKGYDGPVLHNVIDTALAVF